MQAVLLAAGQSSRFYPFTALNHKSHFSLLGKPIILHTLESIHRTGIQDVLLVIRKKDAFYDLLQSQIPSLRITLVEQPEALGMGEALLRVSKHITEDFFLLHPHHIEFDHFHDEMTRAKHSAEGVLLAKKDTELSKYGVLKMEGNRVIDIVEKPSPGTEPSHLRLIGIYLLSKSFLETLQTTPLEHYHFEAALSTYMKNHTFHVSITEKPVITLKYPWDIFTLSHFLLDHQSPVISASAKISPSATISGNVVIEDEVTISDGVRIKGPAYLGKSVFIGDNTIIRNYSVVEEGCTIGAHTEIRNSIFQSGSKIHSGFVGDSLIGTNVRLAAAFYTANRKLDRSMISVDTPKGKIDTGLTSLGVVVGNNVRMGIRVTTMPGVIIGENAIIGPSTTVMKHVPENTRYYTAFQEIVEKNVNS